MRRHTFGFARLFAAGARELGSWSLELGAWSLEHVSLWQRRQMVRRQTSDFTGVAFGDDFLFAPEALLTNARSAFKSGLLREEGAP